MNVSFNAFQKPKGLKFRSFVCVREKTTHHKNKNTLVDVIY